MEFRAAIEGVEVCSIIDGTADRPAVSRGAIGAIDGTPDCRNQRSVRQLGILGNDINDAVDGIRAPYRSTGPANHFNTLDILDRNILDVPEHALKQWGVYDSAIDQNQYILGKLAGKAANR